MIGAIILAAGSSSRMGRQKLMLPYAGRPLIRHIVESVQQGPVQEVVVVTGHSQREVERALERSGVSLAHNPAYEDGMLTSIRVGLRALPTDLAPMVVLGDQPVIPHSVLLALADAIAAKPDGIVVPVHAGKRGHPIVFGRCFREEVARRFGDTGLRGLLRAHPDAVVEIDVDNDGVLTDLDTPEDYEAALAALRDGSSSIKT